jgi:hypothetical protein
MSIKAALLPLLVLASGLSLADERVERLDPEHRKWLE